MRKSLFDSRTCPDSFDPAWRELLASYALVAAVPVALWVVSRPLLGAVTIVSLVASFGGLVVGARRLAELRRRLPDCGGLTVDVGETIQVTVTRGPAGEPC